MNNEWTSLPLEKGWHWHDDGRGLPPIPWWIHSIGDGVTSYTIAYCGEKRKFAQSMGGAWCKMPEPPAKETQQ